MICVKGRVKTFNNGRGFGFIVAESGEDVFFHVSDFKVSGDDIFSGMQVEFDAVEGKKGLAAKNIRRIDSDTPGRPKFFSFQNQNIRLNNIKSFSMFDLWGVCLNGKGHYRINETDILVDFSNERQTVSNYKQKPDMLMEKHIYVSGPSYEYAVGCITHLHTIANLREAGVKVEWFTYPVLQISTFQKENYSFYDLDNPESVKEAYSKLVEYMS